MKKRKQTCKIKIIKLNHQQENSPSNDRSTLEVKPRLNEFVRDRAFVKRIITQYGERISVNFKSIERYLDISIDSRLVPARSYFRVSRLRNKLHPNDEYIPPRSATWQKCLRTTSWNVCQQYLDGFDISRPNFSRSDKNSSELARDCWGRMCDFFFFFPFFKMKCERCYLQDRSSFVD